MSGLRGDDDGGRQPPPDPDGLPGFPSEWGRIVIPDDAAELDRDAARVRRELRREAMFHRYGLRPDRRVHHFALPLVLLVMAVLVTTTSLFAAVWPQHRTTGGRQPAGAPASADRGSTATPRPRALRTGAPLPDLTFTDSSGHPVTLRATRPAVVLVTRNCGCATLIAGTARAAAAAHVSVLVVGGTKQPSMPSLPANAKVVTVTDPGGTLAKDIDAGATSRPSDSAGGALLVNAKGTLIREVPATRSVTDFSPAIPSLS